MKTAKKTKKSTTAAKKTVEPNGCRLCKYRVAPPKGPDGKPTPSCCFGYPVNDDEPMDGCCLFTAGDYYFRNPDAP